MTRQPDEDQDVIVRQVRQPSTTGAAQDAWTVWLDGEELGAFDSLNTAAELACHLATMHSKPAWLLDETGYPLKPIESRASSSAPSPTTATSN